MSAVSDHDRWAAERAAAVSARTGNLALIAYHPVAEVPDDVEELPIRAWRSDSDEGVWVDAHGRATIDGVAVEGAAFLGRLRGDGTPLLVMDRFTVDAFSLDGSDYELRIYDAQAPNVAAFDGIDLYPYDERLVVTGRLDRTAEIAHVPWEFSRASDTGHTKKVPGRLVVEVGGEQRALIAFLDHEHLVLVFADGTTGVESYAPGRFLRMDPPAADGSVVVDFNRSIVPPCGFSDFYSCPIPPPDNRFTVPIRGGEQRVRWTSPRH